MEVRGARSLKEVVEVKTITHPDPLSDVKLPCQEPPSSEFTANKTKQNKTEKALQKSL